MTKLKNHALDYLRYKIKSNNIELADFIRFPYTNELNNLMCIYLQGVKASELSEFHSSRVINYSGHQLDRSVDFVQVMKNLDRINDIILFEDLPSLEVTYSNVNADKQKMTEEERELIIKHNQYDLKLWEVVNN